MPIYPTLAVEVYVPDYGIAKFGIDSFRVQNFHYGRLRTVRIQDK
jgi:hypothetical protein